MDSYQQNRNYTYSFTRSCKERCWGLTLPCVNSTPPPGQYQKELQVAPQVHMAKFPGHQCSGEHQQADQNLQRWKNDFKKEWVQSPKPFLSFFPYHVINMF